MRIWEVKTYYLLSKNKLIGSNTRKLLLHVVLICDSKQLLWFLCLFQYKTPSVKKMPASGIIPPASSRLPQPSNAYINSQRFYLTLLIGNAWTNVVAGPYLVRYIVLKMSTEASCLAWGYCEKCAISVRQASVIPRWIAKKSCTGGTVHIAAHSTSCAWFSWLLKATEGNHSSIGMLLLFGKGVRTQWIQHMSCLWLNSVLALSAGHTENDCSLKPWGVALHPCRAEDHCTRKSFPGMNGALWSPGAPVYPALPKVCSSQIHLPWNPDTKLGWQKPDMADQSTVGGRWAAWNRGFLAEQ